MINRKIYRSVFAAAVVFSTLIGTNSVIAQTQIVAPKNKYKASEDVKLGSEASREVEKQFPLINDSDAQAYIERVGSRLVASIPRQFNQPAFNYRFKWVNASDINAFALPGGPMYINRGMIEAAKNEGEMAGVMAHEISHVALRHATAQATKQSSAKNTLGTIGLILGGAILGGQTGAQLGAAAAAVWQSKYSREFESQADMLGAKIMADAGYDPRDLANMFRTIEQQGGGGGPEWMSSHPNPGNRFEAINREAQYLRVTGNPIKITRDFERTQARFRGMPPARTMAEIAKQTPSGQGSENPTASGRYSNNVPRPSTRLRTYSSVDWLRINVPSNWQEFSGQDGAQFAPEGAFGDQGITHGVMVGVFQGQGSNLRSKSQAYVDATLQGNSYLRQNGSLVSRNLAGRNGYTTQMSGSSPITGRTEVVTVYTTQLRNGQLFYLVTVVPADDSYNYNNAFRSILNSVQLND